MRVIDEITSVIVVVIDEDDIGAIESKRQPPVAGDAHRVVILQTAGQPIKAPARHVHVERPARDVETGELAPQSRRMVRPNTGLAAVHEECCQPFVLPRLDSEPPAVECGVRQHGLHGV